MANPKVRSDVAVAAFDGATFTDIPCTIWCRRMVIKEQIPEPDAEFGVQGEGLAFTSAADNYQTVSKLPPGEPIVLGNPIAEGAGLGPLVGYPAQQGPDGNVISAKVPVRVSSASENPVLVTITEVN